MKDDLDLDIKEEEEIVTANRKAALTQLVAHQAKFLETAREVRTSQFLNAAAQLCHMDTNLAENVWLEMFPRLWAILNARQQEVIQIIISTILLSVLIKEEIVFLSSLLILNKNISFQLCIHS